LFFTFVSRCYPSPPVNHCPILFWFPRWLLNVSQFLLLEEALRQHLFRKGNLSSLLLFLFCLLIGVFLFSDAGSLKRLCLRECLLPDSRRPKAPPPPPPPPPSTSTRCRPFFVSSILLLVLWTKYFEEAFSCPSADFLVPLAVKMRAGFPPVPPFLLLSWPERAFPISAVRSHVFRGQQEFRI